MRRAGKTAEDVGRMIYDMYRHTLETTPREQAEREGDDLVSLQRVLTDRGTEFYGA